MFLSILEEKTRRVIYYLRTFLHWTLLSIITGVTAGGIAGLFAHLITVVTNFRISHPVIILGLPLGGLFIVFLYSKTGLAKDAGTDTVISAVRSDEKVPLAMPLKGYAVTCGYRFQLLIERFRKKHDKPSRFHFKFPLQFHLLQ